MTMDDESKERVKAIIGVSGGVEGKTWREVADLLAYAFMPLKEYTQHCMKCDVCRYMDHADGSHCPAGAALYSEAWLAPAYAHAVYDAVKQRDKAEEIYETLTAAKKQEEVPYACD